MSSVYTSLSIHMFAFGGIELLLQIILGVFLIQAGRQIATKQGSRALKIGCYVFGVVCFLLLLVSVLNWIQFFGAALGPSPHIDWRWMAAPTGNPVAEVHELLY